MLKVEVLYFEGCPHQRATLERTRQVLAELGVAARLRAVEVREGARAARLRFPGSPTVRVDGVDIEPGADASADGALSCRRYAGSGVPPRELLEQAIRSAAARSEARTRRSVVAAGLPAAGLAALPACPACYPLYAGLLSSLGLTALLGAGAQTALTAGFVAIALGALGFRAGERRGYAPLALGIGAALLVLAGKFLLGWSPLAYAGVAVLIAAGVWNAWPGARRGPRCEACVAGEAAR